ncbi:MAG: AzlC family ABC transporter permease [Treponema sp.]|nr:AzlC family ABC transporter permease [Treponema sp.]
MKGTIKNAFISTLPVLAGYVFLGIAFGLLMNSRGFGLPWVLCMSVFIFAGSMQFVAVDLISGGLVSLLTVALTTIMVNARHIFYGISMLDRYKKAGARKPYLIFALTDETYSLVCNGYNLPNADPAHEYDYYFFVSLFDHCWWITGSVIGSLIGELLPFTIKGIDFALTALFVTVFCDQWIKSDNHFFALTGVIASVLCLLIFGADKFLIPAMVVIFAVISIYKFVEDKKEKDKLEALKEINLKSEKASEDSEGKND